MKRIKIETAYDAALVSAFKEDADTILDKIYKKIEKSALAGCSFTTVKLPASTIARSKEAVVAYLTSKNFKVSTGSTNWVGDGKNVYTHTLTIHWD